MHPQLPYKGTDSQYTTKLILDIYQKVNLKKPNQPNNKKTHNPPKKTPNLNSITTISNLVDSKRWISVQKFSSKQHTKTMSPSTPLEIRHQLLIAGDFLIPTTAPSHIKFYSNGDVVQRRILQVRSNQ